MIFRKVRLKKNRFVGLEVLWLDKNYWVAKGHALVEAKKTCPLTANEQKLVLTLVSMIQPNDHEFKEYTIAVKDYIELMGLSGESQYHEMKKMTKLGSCLKQLNSSR